MSSPSSPTDILYSSSTLSSSASSSGPSHLSISTTNTSTNQSSTRCRAQPPPSSPQRTASEPLSAKALRFASVDLGGKKSGSGEREKERGGINRRHSADEKKMKGSGKTNGYTECGRHGDEWLFAGWGKLLGKSWH